MRLAIIMVKRIHRAQVNRCIRMNVLKTEGQKISHVCECMMLRNFYQGGKYRRPLSDMYRICHQKFYKRIGLR